MTNKRKMRQSAEVLSDMATHIACRLTMYGVDKGQSESIAVDIMAYLSDVYGGLNMYFPKGTKDLNEEKYDLVFADFNEGIPIAEIAKKYGYSLQWIYNIIAQKRREYRNSLKDSAA